jgi:hypothetical protein
MNRSSRCEEMTTKMESKYPSLDEVDVIPMPSLGEAFRYAEEQQQQQQQYNGRVGRDQQRPTTRSRQQSPNSCTSSRRSVTSSGGGSKEKRQQSTSTETYSVSSSGAGSPSHKRPPTLQRLKSSDLLDTKPAAVMRPAATPGAVEVNHAPYFMQQYEDIPRHSHHYGGGGGASSSSQASVASQRSRQHPSGSAPAAPAATFPRMELEVSPGIFLPLHGSEETYAALRTDRLCATYCLACETPLFCVEYAAQVLCPACRVVSPVFTHEAPRRNSDYDSHTHPSGVGLGMTVDEYDRTWAEAEERLLAERYSRGYYDEY